MLETREPGVLIIPGIPFAVRLDQWIEGPVYDTAAISAGAISDGAEYKFFTNVAGKNKDQTNLVENGKLPAGWQLIINKMGLELCPGMSKADGNLIIENSYMHFKSGNNKIHKIAPTFCWPSGYGIWGDHAIDTQAALTDYSIAGIGVPSPSAVPMLLKSIYITSQTNIEGLLRFENAVTIGADLEVRMILYGYVSRPVG